MLKVCLFYKQQSRMLESEDPSRTGPLVSQSHEKDIMSPYTLKDDRCCSRFGRGAKRQ